MTRASHFLSLTSKRRLAGEEHRRAVMAGQAPKSIAIDREVAAASRHVALDGRLMRGRLSGRGPGTPLSPPRRLRTSLGTRTRSRNRSATSTAFSGVSSGCRVAVAPDRRRPALPGCARTPSSASMRRWLVDNRTLEVLTKTAVDFIRASPRSRKETASALAHPQRIERTSLRPSNSSFKTG